MEVFCSVILSLIKKSGIEFSNGSLGMGLSLGVGVALAMKKRSKSSNVYVLLVGWRM